MYLISIILGFGTFVTVKGQELSDEERWFEGVLVDSETKEPIDLGVIVNSRLSKACSTNEDGKFYIRGVVGDTLRFRRIGYESNTWRIPGYWTQTIDTIKLEVVSKMYSLETVEVVRFYSYAHFRQAFKNLKLPKEKEVQLNLNLEKHIKEALAHKKAAEGTFGGSMSIPYTSRLQQQKEQLAQVQQFEKKNERMYALTSHENLKDFTGFEGLCLDSFVVFLRVNYPMDSAMGDYDLMSVVKGASDDFRLINKGKEWFNCAGEQVN